jgi:hypothetical protein
LKWIFNTNITPGTTGSIFLNFSKTGTGQFTNTGQLYGWEYTCDIINNNSTVKGHYFVEPAYPVAPSNDVLIDKKEGNCNPTSGIIPWGGWFFAPGMISGLQLSSPWNCTDVAPWSKYSLGDDVYYTLYVHNFGPNLINRLAVADKFTKNTLQLVSISGNYFGQKSYISGSDFILFNNGFSLWVNRGAYVTLKFKVIADEYSPIDNEAKVRVMQGDPSQNTWSKIYSDFDSLTFPGDIDWTNNSSSIQVFVKDYDLAIQKSLIWGTETPWATVVYRLNFSNTGIARTDILIRDKFTFSWVKIQSWAGSPGLIVDIPPVFTAWDDFWTQFRQGIHLWSNSTGFINITVKLPTLSLWCVNPPAFRNLAAIGTNAGIPWEEPGIYINRNDSNITNNNALLSIAVLPAAMDPNCGVVSSPYDLRITKTADKATVNRRRHSDLYSQCLQ